MNEQGSLEKMQRPPTRKGPGNYVKPAWLESCLRAASQDPDLANQLPAYRLQKLTGPTHADFIAVRVGAPDEEAPCSGTPPKACFAWL